MWWVLYPQLKRSNKIKPNINNNNNNVMYCQVWWPILEICAMHLTHPSAHTQQWVVNTHTVNTHPEQWAAIAPAPGEQLGVRCLAQGHLSHGIEGGESAVHSQSPPSIPAGPEIRTHNLWITSLTLTIRPRLPLNHTFIGWWFQEILYVHFSAAQAEI